MKPSSFHIQYIYIYIYVYSKKERVGWTLLKYNRLNQDIRSFNHFRDYENVVHYLLDDGWTKSSLTDYRDKEIVRRF